MRNIRVGIYIVWIITPYTLPATASISLCIKIPDSEVYKNKQV